METGIINTNYFVPPSFFFEEGGGRDIQYKSISSCIRRLKKFLLYTIFIFTYLACDLISKTHLCSSFRKKIGGRARGPETRKPSRKPLGFNKLVPTEVYLTLSLASLCFILYACTVIYMKDMVAKENKFLLNGFISYRIWQVKPRIPKGPMADQCTSLKRIPT